MHSPTPPFRAGHVGSLIRPQALADARQAAQAKQITAEELKKAEDEAISDVVKKQRELGLKSINDGELRRTLYFEGVFDNLEGMTFIPNRPLTEFKSYVPFIPIFQHMGMKEFPSFYCTGKIKRVKPFFTEQFKYVKSLVPPEELKNVKVTMCPPTWFHQRHGPELTYDRSVYANDDEYFSDLAQAYREEIKDLYDLGCRHIQFDDPTFCFLCSDVMIQGMKAENVDGEALLDTYIRAINMCIENRPADLKVSLHMCRGNFKGMGFCEGSYAPISSKAFKELNVDIFFLEFDTPRAGDFTPLKDVPSDKTVMLGLVSTKVPEVESVEYLRSRVEEAAEAMAGPSRSKNEALNQLGISPQCGFASVSGDNVVSEEVQWEKLKVLVEAERAIWPH